MLNIHVITLNFKQTTFPYLPMYLHSGENEPNAID